MCSCLILYLSILVIDRYDQDVATPVKTSFGSKTLTFGSLTHGHLVLLFSKIVHLAFEKIR